MNVFHITPLSDGVNTKYSRLRTSVSEYLTIGTVIITTIKTRLLAGNFHFKVIVLVYESRVYLTYFDYITDFLDLPWTAAV